ncbi:MAG TPA: MBL fold metallo-hydrolase [Terrimicrobiaceae bacterium]
MKLSYYGHSCFSVEIGGKILLFDPFITPNSLASHIRLDQVQADYILISHGHFDHIADAVEIAKRTEATVVSNYEIVLWLGKQGIDKAHPLNHGGGWTFDFGRVKYVNAVHSSQLPDGAYGVIPEGSSSRTIRRLSTIRETPLCHSTCNLSPRSSNSVSPSCPSETISRWGRGMPQRLLVSSNASRSSVFTTTHSL